MSYPGEIFLVDKPYRWTSFDVVGKLRWILRYHYGEKVKLGHAGTLDPLATGLLILCSGPETKNISRIQAREKEYTGEIFLGATTASYDLETPVEPVDGVRMPSPEEILAAASELTGTYLQKPPMHSAKWIDGKRAYAYARKGQEADIKSAEVTVKEFEITKTEWPIVSFRITCSRGTYIRSIAHDLGMILGTGAYLHSLRRTRIGEHVIAQATTLEELEKKYLPRYTRHELKLR